mmetsp:Transcript_6234/g.7686  ORF Transcript_6234/g.7686 Transcript_6234/m.7686 type:complete len:96 (+) Transcript_6234:124-411(+)
MNQTLIHATTVTCVHLRQQHIHQCTQISSQESMISQVQQGEIFFFALFDTSVILSARLSKPEQDAEESKVMSQFQVSLLHKEVTQGLELAHEIGH